MKDIISLLLIILPIASCITSIFKIKQEKSIFVTFISIYLLMYLCGIINVLGMSIYIIYFISICSLICTIYYLVKKKIMLRQIFSIGTIFFVLFVLILYIITKNTHFVEWDEFSHWGSNLKAMVNKDILWANARWDGVHIVYPPISGISEYFMCKIHGEFSEAVSYLGLDIFMLATIMPIFSKTEYNFKDSIRIIATVISIYALIGIFGFSLTSLYIDLLVGLLFFSGLYFTMNMNESKFDKIILALIFSVLVLTKDVGIIFGTILLLIIFVREVLIEVIKNKKICKRNWKIIGYAICLFLILILSYGSWKIYCGCNNKFLDDRHDKNGIDTFSISTYVKSIFLKSDGKYKDITRIFYKNLNEKELVKKYPFSTILQIWIVYNLIGILIYKIAKKGEKKNIFSIWFSLNIGFIGYLAFLLMIYLFAMTEVEGKNLASISRYIGSFYIAWLLLIVSNVFDNSSKKFYSIFILFFICIYGCDVCNCIVPGEYNKEQRIDDSIIQQSNIINENVDINDKVYIINQNDKSLGLNFHQLRYCISPRTTNLLFEWSLGIPYRDNDIWTLNLSLEEFEKKLIDENYQYVFFQNCDEQFMSIYGEMVESNKSDLNNKLFKIQKDNGKVILRELVNN